MEKILIIQTAFIGDVVLATGLCEKLHQYYPECKIDFLLRKGNEGLLEGHPFVNTIIWNKKENKYKNLFKILQHIRNSRYDFVINVQRYAATGFLTVFSKAKYTIGFDKNPWSSFFTKKVKHRFAENEKNIIHEIGRNNELIKDLTDSVPAKPVLYPSPEDFYFTESYKNAPYICIAPSSVWFTKQYPAEKWVSFINRIGDGLKIYLLGAPGDNELCEKIKTKISGKEIVNLAGKLNFLQSAALMKNAQMNYVNDSAPMHFASSVNAPVTVVYCSTVPAFGYGPLSDVQNIIQVQETLSCRPCGLHGYKECPQKHFKCALDITEEQLLRTLVL